MTATAFSAKSASTLPGRPIDAGERARGITSGGSQSRQIPMVAIDYTKLRDNMVEGQIRTSDVTKAAVIDAFREVPRERFVPEEWRYLAYIDEDIAVGDGETRRHLMEPAPLARLIQLAELRPEDHVLEIGTATGYSAALISRIAGTVIALESDGMLAGAARENLLALGCDNVTVVEGPLPAGHDAGAPYDVIFINGAVDFVPEALFGQLRDGGRLVAIVGRGNTGMATLWRSSKDGLSSWRAFNAAVAPLAGFERAPSFEF